DAMEECAVRNLTISAHATESVIEISFQDSGPGVPPDKAESLFQPFFTTKAVGKGTGLGLYISRGIIEEFSGTLCLGESSSGARFVIRIPLAKEVSP
ncbi:MAG: hypothetical protein RL173_3068, partial [Fibrobacterota bacterium]